jgi:ATP-dependent DNA helicase RecG
VLLRVDLRRGSLWRWDGGLASRLIVTIAKRLKIDENQNTEFKRIWKDEYLKWICGFANSTGGILFLGVSDDGSVVGIDNYKELLEQLPNKFRDLLGLYAEINLLYENELPYLKIQVLKHEVPVSYKGKYFVRSGSTLQELKGTALNDFILKKMGRSWESETEDYFSIDHIDLKTIEKFKVLAADRLPFVQTEKNPMILLEKLNLTQDGKLKRAAILLFGKDVQRLYLQARVKIGLFSSDTDLISADLVEGNLFQQMEQTLDVLKKKYLLSPISYDGVHR